MSRFRRPASLRGRVVLGVLGLLTLLLVALFVAVDVTLAARLRSDLRTRLEDRVALAEQLDGALSPQQLVDRLTGDGVAVQLCSSTSSSSSSSSLRCVSPVVAPGRAKAGRPGGDGNGPPGGPGAPASPVGGSPEPKKVASAPITQDGSSLYVRTTLPQSGQQLSLSVDGTEVGSTVRGLVLSEVIGGLLVLVLAALLLGRVVGVALRPLESMTALARRIAGGDRGRRLGTTRTDTELGRTATAFDAMLDELEAALGQADAAQARLRQFLGDASHELRSPLAGLHARAEQLLRDEPDHAAREQAYVAMVRESRRANRLVDDLLTVARFDQEPVELVRAPVDLVEIVGHEIDRVRLRASSLSVRSSGAGTAPAHGDPQRLAQVFGNVLDNAVRAAGPAGVVEVDVSCADAMWCVDVRDDGPGVPDGSREVIFDRLVRLDASRARGTGGFGLGLPIARTLARAHGGDVTCLAAERGAHFRVTVPGS